MDGQDRTQQEEDHILSLDLNMTKASALYLAVEQALVVFKGKKTELLRTAIALPNGHKDPDLMEALEILATVIPQNQEVLQDLEEIIKELEPVNKKPPTNIITKL